MALPACRGCQAALPVSMLSCPSCGTLVHAEELQRIADEAKTATSVRDQFQIWKRALPLLPPASRQYRVIMERVEALAKEVDRGTTAEPTAENGAKPKQKRNGIAAVATAGVLILSKFKFLIVLLLTKAKFLILGFSKLSTLLTMFVSFGAYWTLFGWKFAAGLVLSIYIHEMGHVAMLRKFGVPATAPMFIPGLGAVIRLRTNPATPLEDARMGLAGPIWGLGAALAAWGLAMVFQSHLFAAIAHVGAFINLFNLLPVWQLDGSRAFRALTRQQRWIAVATLLAAYLLWREPMVPIISCVAVWRAFGKDVPEKPDWRALGEYCGLVLILTALIRVSIAM